MTDAEVVPHEENISTPKINEQLVVCSSFNESEREENFMEENIPIFDPTHTLVTGLSDDIMTVAIVNANERVGNTNEHEDLGLIIPLEDRSFDENHSNYSIRTSGISASSSGENGDDGVATSKKRIMKGDQRVSNKKLRMIGKKYLGFSRPRGQANTFHDKNREERILKPRCSCKNIAKNPTRKCFLITDDMRQRLFVKFWSNMTWEQRKVFVGNTVKVCSKNRPRKSYSDTDVESRRAVTLKYNIVISNNEIVPVCKKMYLNTFCLGEWSVRSWALRAEDGMSNNIEKDVSLRKKRVDVFETDRAFSNWFLTAISPVMPDGVKRLSLDCRVKIP